VIAYFVPEMTPTNVNLHVKSSRTSQTTTVHTKMSAGGARSVVLTIPYVHRLNKLNIPLGISPTNIQGTLTVQVFNSLTVGADAIQNSAALSIFARFKNPTFEILNRAPPSLESFRAMVFSASLYNVEAGFLEIDAKEEDDEEQRAPARRKRRQRKVAYAQGGYLSVARNVTRILHGGIDFADTTWRAGRAIQRTRFDYPNMGTNPVPQIPMGGLDLANGMNQLQYCRVLDIAPARGDVLTEEDTGTNAPEMSIAYLAAKPTFWETFRWSASDAPGSVLYSEHITVTPGMLASVVNSSYQPTLMEYVLLPYNFWRGDIVVKIEVIGTQFHSGRLAVCTSYGGYTDPTSLSDALLQYAQIADVSATAMQFEAVIPWRGDREMCRIAHHPGFDDIRNFSIGRYTIVVVNPLQFGEVADSVEVNVYLSVTNLRYDFPGFGPASISIVDPYT